MIVCHCFCVSDRQIRQCAGRGARTVAEVGQQCRAGSGCGGCRPEIAEIVKAESAQGCASLPVLKAAG
jgi:bacterioferritin-associated ferredoxin